MFNSSGRTKGELNYGKTVYSSPLLSQIAQAIRVRHYSIRTEKSYIDWIKRFIYFHRKRHPNEMGETEVAAFLTHLAVNRNVAVATQSQALNALVFLYRVVLEKPLQAHIQGIVRAKKTEKTSGRSYQERGSQSVIKSQWRLLVIGMPVVWIRPASHREHAFASDGS